MKIYLGLLLALITISCKVQKNTSFVSNEKEVIIEKQLLTENTSHLRDSSLAPFYHGVASGDPYEESVVIWTRVSPAYQMNNIGIEWEMSLEPTFKNILQEGTLTTNPAKDYTVKTIVESLKQNTVYYYRFNALGSYSQTGKTKTLPSI